MAKQRDPVEEFGRKLMSGAMLELGKWVIIGSLVLTGLAYTRSALGYGWDDTDNRAAGVHSELKLLTDHRTGCQYLRAAAGGITPRMDVAGHQVCG